MRVVPPDELRALIGGGARGAGRRLPSLQAALARRRLAALADEGAERLLLSDENVMGLTADIVAAGALYPAARARLGLFRRLAEGRRLTVWLSVRAYGPFLAGVHAQSLIGRTAAPLSDRARARLAALPRRWPHVVADIRAALPDAQVTLWDYDDYAALRPAILAGMTGLDNLAPVNRRPMATPGARAMAALFAAGGRLDRARMNSAAAAEAGDAPYEPFLPEERAALAAAWAEDRTRLAAEPGWLSPPVAPP